MWLQHPQLQEIVHFAWQQQASGSVASQLQDKIRTVSTDLSLWHKENFGNLRHQISEAQQKVYTLHLSIQHHHQRNEELIARKKLEFLLKCEEIKWAQRAKHLWLLKGDRNTKYFHNIVKHHRMRSRINRIQLSTGQCTEDQAAIKGAAKDYFTQLYSSTDICDDVARNSFINALFQMDGNKAPGPDGMSPMFFQHCWETVQQDVTRTLGSFLSRGHILRTLNQTHIALIPKVDSPQGFKDYRPISLCNTTYKIISKCVTTATMKVKINGELTDWIIPQAGLRQGDPLSPYLFVLCANVLSNYLIQAQTSKSIKGIKIARNAPIINHLMYADDILMFFRADRNTCNSVSTLLNKFGEMAGLSMNRQKSEIKFSPNISQQGAQILTGIFNCKKVDHLGRYLGGFIDGHDTAKRNASLILDNIQQRLAGWKAKMLSQAARTTLIKAVVSAVPLFYMQHTWLSHSQADKCEAAMRKFFWGHWEDSKTPIMISWDKLCRRREEGGMGFRRMMEVNEALLAKQVWRILTLEDSLVSKVFMGKCRSSFQSYQLMPKPNSSPLWKKLCRASRVVTDHIGWRVGNGEKIKLNDAKWIRPDYQNHSFEKLCDLMHPGGFWDTAKVAQVYNPHHKAIILDTVVSRTGIADKWVWLLTKNGDFSVRHAYKAITNTPLVQRSGCNWTKLWKLPLPQRILHFWWKTINNGLPLRWNLARKGFQIPAACPHGCDAPETAEHILKDCQYARRVWFASRLNLKVDELPAMSMIDGINQVMNSQNTGNPSHQRQLTLLLISLCWSIYTQRNLLLFQQGKADIMECLQRAYHVVDAINGLESIQSQDYFFKLPAPTRVRGMGSDTIEHNLNPTQFTCAWTHDCRLRRKVISILHLQGLQPRKICSLVVDHDQHTQLAMLKTIRLFLEQYGTEQMGAINIHIPNEQIVHQLRSTTKASIRFQTIINDIFNICTNKDICINFQFCQNHRSMEGGASTWPIGWYPLNYL
ncbi:ribonuclease H [Senna tora]|uniref:Ribonuclease H n=1 Tax=Senna tora TaxID=362788 RepID=A0A834ST65_9FABA|nr:ribonuclease H [Senna tora]